MESLSSFFVWGAVLIFMASFYLFRDTQRKRLFRLVAAIMLLMSIVFANKIEHGFRDGFKAG